MNFVWLNGFKLQCAFLLPAIVVFFLSKGTNASVDLGIKSSFNPSKNGSLYLRLDQYINTTENSSDQNIYYDLNKKLILTAHQDLNLDLSFNWSQNEKFLYSHFENLFYSIKDQNSQLDIGVKKISWSNNLDFFNSPEWQQQLEKNRFHPLTGGNLGLFYGLNSGSIYMDLMYSPYVLPTRGPDVSFKNGLTITQNPWLLVPPTEVPYNGDVFRTSYNLQDFDLFNFFNRDSIAVRMQTLNSDKWSVNLAYANKPSPRLLTDLDFKANVSDPNVPIDILIKPRVIRHQLISAELNYVVNSFNKFTFGLLNENFSNQNYKSQSDTFMKPLDQNIMSLVYNHKNKKYEIAIGGIYRDGGKTTAVGELASALVNQNLNYIYERAVKFDFTYFKTMGWTINSSFAYDFAQKGVLGSVNLQRSVNQVVVNLGLDMLEPINTTDQTSFVYQYRNLDRVWAGVNYVF